MPHLSRGVDNDVRGGDKASAPRGPRPSHLITYGCWAHSLLHGLWKGLMLKLMPSKCGAEAVTSWLSPGLDLGKGNMLSRFPTQGNPETMGPFVKHQIHPFPAQSHFLKLQCPICTCADNHFFPPTYRKDLNTRSVTLLHIVCANDQCTEVPLTEELNWYDFRYPHEASGRGLRVRVVWASSSLSKVSLEPTLPYHFMSSRWPTPGRRNGRLGLGCPQGKFNILVGWLGGLPPGERRV
jgi:hypothetical protein